MSASLVGSEMCIRDSLLPEQHCGRCAPAVGQHGCGSSVLQVVLPRRLLARCHVAQVPVAGPGVLVALPGGDQQGRGPSQQVSDRSVQ
eukprot:14036956-Alexandrium_andersonii.AAC.1